MKKLTFLFVYESMGMGGIETLLVRMSNWLVGHGYRVKLLLFLPGELMEMLDERVEVKILGKGSRRYLLPRKSKFLANDPFLQDIDILYSFSAFTCLFSANLYKSMDSRPVFLTGIYNPREYFRLGKYDFRTLLYGRLLNNFVRDEAIIFMNTAVLDNHEKFFKRRFSESLLLPLAVDESYYTGIVREPRKFKIISIGRLVDFKTYNFYMIDIVKNLVENGYEVLYEIYGYGPLENKLRLKIKTNGLEDQISLKGKIGYREFGDVLKDAYLFVGTGTSLIEAAFCKVPSVAAISYESEPLSHGYFHQMRGYNFGEKLHERPTKNVYDLITKLFEMSEQEYENEMQWNYEAAQEYSINPLMERFIEICSNVSKDTNPSGFPSFLFYIYIVLSVIKTFLKRLRQLASPGRKDVQAA